MVEDISTANSRMLDAFKKFWIWKMNNDEDFRERVKEALSVKVNMKHLGLPKELIDQAMYKILLPGRK